MSEATDAKPGVNREVNGAEAIGYYEPERRGLISRLLARLFPEKGWPELPDEPAPGFVPSALRTEAFVFVTWPDRFRLLLSGRLVVKVQTCTDVVVGKAASASTASVVARGPLSQPPENKE